MIDAPPRKRLPPRAAASLKSAARASRRAAPTRSRPRSRAGDARVRPPAVPRRPPTLRAAVARAARPQVRRHDAPPRVDAPPSRRSAAMRSCIAACHLARAPSPLAPRGRACFDAAHAESARESDARDRRPASPRSIRFWQLPLGVPRRAARALTDRRVQRSPSRLGVRRLRHGRALGARKRCSPLRATPTTHTHRPGEEERAASLARCARSPVRSRLGVRRLLAAL